MHSHSPSSFARSSLDWSRSALLAGEVSVNELTADEIIVARKPITATTPTPEAGGFSLPELPVSITIGRLAAGLGLSAAPAPGASVQHYEGVMGSGPWRMVVVEAEAATLAAGAPRRRVAVLMNMGQRVDLGGDVAEHVARPALLVLPLVPKLTHKIDPRYLVSFGFLVFAISCFMNMNMSADYAGPQLIQSLIVRALGQPFIMVPLSLVATASLTPEEIPSSSTLLNVLRNLGGALGTALLTQLVSQRERFHSVRVGESLTLQFDPSKVLLFDAKTGERLGVAGQSQADARSANVAQFKGR